MRVRVGVNPLSAAGIRRLGVVFAAVLAVLTLTAGPAAAHAALSGSDPAEGARLDAAPAAVTLTFNENIQSSFTTLNIVGPDGKQYGRGEPRAAGATLTVGFDPQAPAGSYTVGYRVVSEDGHPIQGSYGFELTRVNTSTPATTPADATAPAAPTTTDENSSATDDSSGVPVWLLALGVGIVLIAGLGVVLLTGRRGR
ncbi:copper resistance protein CopC [Nocardia sp. 2]|uniref:Copper resistance protein CopC n=1 Tax=Nocardia acididurans TaxID=2802282 RepID=A0ABS1M9G0_9NOCA|nr:copper resistance CopC family protein [Nocardia acididurans]MBL1076780.1 copper resistance protein CopC [Nocardia acididurans]